MRLDAFKEAIGSSARVTSYDDGASPDQAGQLAARLIDQDKAVVIAGTCYGRTASAVSQVCQTRGTLFVDVASRDDALPGAGSSDSTTFRLNVPHGMLMYAVGIYLQGVVSDGRSALILRNKKIADPNVRSFNPDADFTSYELSRMLSAKRTNVEVSDGLDDTFDSAVLTRNFSRPPDYIVLNTEFPESFLPRLQSIHDLRATTYVVPYPTITLLKIGGKLVVASPWKYRLLNRKNADDYLGAVAGREIATKLLRPNRLSIESLAGTTIDNGKQNSSWRKTDHRAVQPVYAGGIEGVFQGALGWPVLHVPAASRTGRDICPVCDGTCGSSTNPCPTPTPTK